MSTTGAEAGEILTDLWAIFQAIMDGAEPAMESLGLSMKAYFLLDCVDECPFPAEIARRMHMPPPTVTYLIKQLEGLGFLDRAVEARDLRKFRLRPTAEGRDALRRAREMLGAALSDRLGRLGAADVAAFARIARRLATGDDGADRAAP